ncbi:allantoate deiminase [Paenibacillus lutimineralis]|uniref:Allantoate amidohydrolase n=1 Tax=Paenibacillus lutimineralis TaxID=2707005 RepID=A0A3Q9I810_9BACL|nr:allantoate deiminase [Paenibacillus lutimineralis]AZS13410.1 allantoate amidohydrolase [Paenibacillus lutimineralis]
MTELSKDIMQLLEWLGYFGNDPEGGVTRLLYTKEWLEAQKALEHWMNTEGFDVHFDEVGNLFGGLQGTKYPNETIMTGSHVDTVRNGGLYDGQFGIVAGLLALKHLKETHGQPLRSLQLVSMAEEEGSRFPYAFWGSKNIVGTARREEVENISDFDGIAFVDAMRDCGFHFRNESATIRQDLKAFVEIHIEQGSVLEKEAKSVGVVNNIVGQRRFTVEVTGEANHAGTTPMGYRKDAVQAASAMICDVINRARVHGDPLVATVGKIEVKPNVVNVVPGHALFTLDIRHTEKSMLVQFTEEITTALNQIAKDMNVGLQIDMWMDADPVPMDTRIVEVIEQQCKEIGLNYKLMHSGAGHDSQILAGLTPTAMIFVPSKDGISHNPAEYTDPYDLAEGVKALIGTLYTLAYEE